MIIAPEPLAEAKKKKILTLIGSEDFVLLRLLLESRVLELEAKSANELAKQTTPADGVADGERQDAAAIRNFFKIISQYQKGENLHFARISAETFK